MNALLKPVLFWITLISTEPLLGHVLNSFKELDTEITPTTKHYSPEDILVLFDVNYTLLFVDHPAMFIPNLKKHAKEMQAIMSGLSKEEQNIIIGLATKAKPQRLVEECIPDVVRSLQEKGMKVLAFSAALSGDLYGLDSRDWFSTALKSHGMDFASSFPNTKPFTFDDFPLYADSQPTYSEGIVLTNKSSKGAVLVSFLKRTEYHPKVVVLIDNKKANVEEVEATLKAFNPDIGFIGLDYNRGQEYAPQEIDDDSFLKWWKTLPMKGVSQEISLKNLQNEEKVSHLREVSDFYNAFYRNPPYFYDASSEAWDRYIRSFVDSPESVLCLAMQEDAIIGIVIGTPLIKTTQKYKAAFVDHPDDLHSLFFLGELSVIPGYEQLGVNQLLCEEFEHAVAKQQRFSGICVWQMESEKNQASGLFWRKMGFADSGIRFDELWKDTFGTEKVSHSMMCWKKSLQ